MRVETSRVGKRGTMVIPTSLRKRFGIQDGSFIIAEEREDGILIRPAVAVPVEVYTLARQAEYLLTNTVDAADYARAVEEVRKLGVEPDNVPHHKPDGI